MIHDKTLYIHDGEGKYVPAPSNLVIEEAKRRLGARLEGLNALTSPMLARDAIRFRFAGLEHEVFACLFLDNQHRVIKFEEMFRGTIDGASVYPREVAKAALACNSVALMYAPTKLLFCPMYNRINGLASIFSCVQFNALTRTIVLGFYPIDFITLYAFCPRNIVSIN